LFNEGNQLNHSKLSNHFRELNIINATANVLFAKILALEIGKQFSNNNNSLNQDLMLHGSKLRQQIEKVSANFAKDFNIN
jgi:hypothetical protein